MTTRLKTRTIRWYTACEEMAGRHEKKTTKRRQSGRLTPGRMITSAIIVGRQDGDGSSRAFNCSRQARTVAVEVLGETDIEISMTILQSVATAVVEIRMIEMVGIPATVRTGAGSTIAVGMTTVNLGS